MITVKTQEVSFLFSGDTKRLMRYIHGNPKRPIFLQGGLGSGKTICMFFIAETYLGKGKKVIILNDSPEEEGLMFCESYKTLWLLPIELEGCYEKKHPNLRIEYVDIKRTDELFFLISDASESVIYCPDFYAIFVFAISKSMFKKKFYHFPESVLVFVELSDLLRSREWQSRKNIAGGSLLKMIRHQGTLGFNLIGDMQTIKDVDVTFRRTGGAIYLWKRKRLHYDNSVDRYLLQDFPYIAYKIQKLKKNEYVALVDEKLFFCENVVPTFFIEKRNFHWSNYYRDSSSNSLFEEIKLYNRFQNKLQKVITLKLLESSKKLTGRERLFNLFKRELYEKNVSIEELIEISKKVL